MDGNRELMIIKSILFLLFISFFLSCLPDKKQRELAPYPYMAEINPTRNKVGLKIIDSSFLEYNSKGLSYSTINEKGNYQKRLFSLKSYNSEETSGRAYFWKKSIFFNPKTGEPVSETDFYRSGKSKYGLSSEGEIYESLSFRFDYKDFTYVHDNFKVPMRFIKSNKQYYHNVIDTLKITSSNRPELLKRTHWELKNRKVSKKEADSILKSWGLTR